MKSFLKNNWQIIIIELLTIIVFITFYGKFGDIMVDSFREAYIPNQMIKGQVLYKNIFCIYPPFAYLLNTLLFFIFGAGLKVLYLAGLFTTMGIIFLTFKIGEIFLQKKYCLTLSLFLISALALSPNAFTPFFPYSYGILYGLLFILGTIYFALKEKFPISYLLYSLAICSKYEFVLLLPVLAYFSKTKDWKKNLTALILPPVIILLILFVQGLRLTDLKAAFELINTMSATKSLYWFYSVMGLTFRVELIPIYISAIIKFFIPINWSEYQEVLIWAFPVIFLGSIFRFKNLNSKEKFFLLATLIISLKVFFALTLQSYGVFFLPFALISLFILTPDKFRKILLTLFIIWSIIIGVKNYNLLNNKNFKLEKITAAVQSLTKENDRVLIYPECLAINFLSNRNSDNKLYSLIPLYVETFEEDVITERFEITKPEYIIINNYDTSAYYFKEFGNDYAENIKQWILKNYSLESVVNDNWEFKIYKKLP